MEEPNENFMRAVEEKVGIAETAKDDFRREILEAIGAMAG